MRLLSIEDELAMASARSDALAKHGVVIDRVASLADAWKGRPSGRRFSLAAPTGPSGYLRNVPAMIWANNLGPESERGA